MITITQPEPSGCYPQLDVRRYLSGSPVVEVDGTLYPFEVHKAEHGDELAVSLPLDAARRPPHTREASGTYQQS